MTSILAELSDHDAEDFELALVTNHGISKIGWAQHILAFLLVEILQGEFIVDDGNYNIAHPGVAALFHYHHVAAVDAGAVHGIALHRDQHRFRRMSHQIFVDGERVVLMISGRARKTRLHTFIYAPLEEAPAGPQPLVRGGFQIARQLEAVHQGCHRTLGAKPRHLHVRGVGRHHAVRGLVVLEAGELSGVVTHAASLWNDRSFVKPARRMYMLGAVNQTAGSGTRGRVQLLPIPFILRASSFIHSIERSWPSTRPFTKPICKSRTWTVTIIMTMSSPLRCTPPKPRSA